MGGPLVKFAWVDLRSVRGESRDAILDAAIHARLDGVVDESAEALSTVPPTLRKVVIGSAEDADENTLVIDQVRDAGELTRDDEKSRGAYVDVFDDASLKLACSAALVLPYVVVRFRDPTKIPLEILIAAADSSPTQLVCEVTSLEEAKIVLDVLEKGSEGLLLAPRTADDVFGLAALLNTRTPSLELSVLTVESIEHSGAGDRVCVDTCTQLGPDEGILVGSFAHGFVLCSSETHPLPYMPTRPFRVNAGALHSYVLGLGNRTNYLSELASGAPVLAVRTDGTTRQVIVGRTKLETRPLLTIKAVSESGVPVALTVQDDWHVRLLGPEGAVLNVTELTAGQRLLVHVATDKRHVGFAVEEFCLEK
jgi:3-amino-4-hydroxybenzoic acid synthase